MGEALFGLIMTLTFTLGADLIIQEQGREGARQMLIGILGCNLAWGLIDGCSTFSIVPSSVDGCTALVTKCVRRRVRSGPVELVAAELDELLVPLTDAQQRDSLYAAIVQRVKTESTAPRPVTRKDLLGGLESGVLVFACSFPAVLPFLLFDEPQFALRVSNAVLLALLYYLGYRHAKHTLARPWIAGLVFMLAGLFLVAIAIQLGG